MTTPPPPLVELRSYELVGGGAGAFVEHFDAHLLATQEAEGMDILGQFTVAGRDDRFTWVRRFPEPGRRGAALTAFYTGAAWKEHGPRANELMLDFSDVHLLVPHPSGPPVAADHVPHADRPAGAPAGEAPDRTVVAAIYRRPELDDALAAAMDDATSAAGTAGTAGTADAAGAAGGVHELGRLVTAGVANDFPPLPVHEEPVVVWLLSAPGDGAPAVAAAEAVARPDELLRLRPTAHSTLR